VEIPETIVMSYDIVKLSEDEKKKIIQALNAKTKGTCPMCGTRNWIVSDGYSTIDVQPDLQNQVIGGPNIPAATIICKHCGFLSQHAALILGVITRT
jgi:predicted RNA-binding Zn-ribbon protein involved in translation (DUF1610 family)